MNKKGKVILCLNRKIGFKNIVNNIEYAYEMIGMLRKYRTTVMAIDQPIDFSVPESAVMLAIYLSVPEAENTRRALNTASGIRRRRQMGRCPNKAPF